MTDTVGRLVPLPSIPLATTGGEAAKDTLRMLRSHISELEKAITQEGLTVIFVPVMPAEVQALAADLGRSECTPADLVTYARQKCGIKVKPSPGAPWRCKW